MQIVIPLALVALLVLFIVAVRRRFFARFRNGFGVMMAIALAGAGVATAAVLGTWGYFEARQIVIDEQVDAISDVGDIAAHRMAKEVDTAVKKLDSVATGALVDRALKEPAGATELLSTLQTFNRRVLQFSVFDRDGKPIVTSTADSAREPINRVAVAYALEGKDYVSEPYVSSVFKKEILSLSAPCKDSDGTVKGVVTMRYDLQSSMTDMVTGLGFGSTGYAVIIDGSGRVMAHPDANRIGTNVADRDLFKAAMTNGVGSFISNNLTGTRRLFVYRQIPNPATTGGAPLVLLSQMSWAEAMQPVYHMEKMFAVASGAVAIVWALVAMGISRAATRPIRSLLNVVGAVSKGDLAARTDVHGRDEIGQFADALNEMIAGLQERERVKKVFGRYIATQVRDRVLQAGEQGIAGERKRVTILFADIRNFTTMSEAMAPEKVVEFLNEYFSEMVSAVIEHGGVLDKFIGDGIMACFGAVDETPDPERRAVMAGLRMKANLAKLNGERSLAGKEPIHIGIGIHTAEVVVGNIGTADHANYTVIGDGVNTCARVESANKEFGTTLLITKPTQEKLGESFECRAMGEAKLKGKTNVPPLFEVISLRMSETAKAA